LCSGSISRLFSSTEALFKPVQFHLELPDLAAEFRLQHFIVFFVLPAMIRKQLRQILKKLLTPLVDLVGMDPIIAGNLGYGLLSFECFQDNSCLESGIVVTPPHVPGLPFLLPVLVG
jgi:hypothetical protein